MLQAPLWLEFQNADVHGKPIKVIYKAGDDLRQDKMTLNLLQLMSEVSPPPPPSPCPPCVDSSPLAIQASITRSPCLQHSLPLALASITPSLGVSLSHAHSFNTSRSLAALGRPPLSANP